MDLTRKINIGLTLLLVLLPAGNSLPWSQTDKQEGGRIVNGQEAKQGEIPYQVSIQMRTDNNRLESQKPMHFCGGAMIAQNYVLTAAHCTLHAEAKSMQVVAGTNDISDVNSPIFRVKRVIRNEYNDISKRNDLALLELELTPEAAAREGDGQHTVKPVQPCRPAFQPQGKNCTVSGWGHMKAKGSTVPTKLREVSVLVLHDESCQKMLKDYPWDPETSSMICAGGEDKDACQGDSGGPIVCQDGEESVCLAGVVSWGVGCATEGIPGVYTNVRKYVEWIEEMTQGNSAQQE